MARPSANLRLFAAVYPRQELVRAWLSRLREQQLPPHRVTPEHQVHLTLLFIGDTPVKQMDETIESVQRSCAGLDDFTLTPRRFIALPDEKPNRPRRLIAVETDAPSTLLELQRRLASRLASKAREKPGRAYRPHLTLCRFQPPASLDPLTAGIEPISFAVQSVSLMRSKLGTGGAEHIEVHRVHLTNT